MDKEIKEKEIIPKLTSSFEAIEDVHKNSNLTEADLKMIFIEGSMLAVNLQILIAHPTNVEFIKTLKNLKLNILEAGKSTGSNNRLLENEKLRRGVELTNKYLAEEPIKLPAALIYIYSFLADEYRLKDTLKSFQENEPTIKTDSVVLKFLNKNINSDNNRKKYIYDLAKKACIFETKIKTADKYYSSINKPGR